MKRVSRVAFLLTAIMLAFSTDAAVAQQKRKARPAAKDQVWQVDFLMDGEHYLGTMTLTTSRGSVTGTMLIESPRKVTGDVQGKRTPELMSLDYPYTMEGESCGGRVQVEVKFAANGQEGTGTAHAVDCNNQPMDGTVTFKKGTNR